jgi:hypothetical protein
MSGSIIVKNQRGNPATTIFPHEPVRLDNISAIVIAGSGGGIPYNSFMLYSERGIPDIKQGDLLINIYTNEQYRVSGFPEIFDESYIGAMVEKIVGNKP